MKKVQGHPDLRRDNSGVIHNVDKEKLRIAKLKKEKDKLFKEKIDFIFESQIYIISKLEKIETLLNGRSK